MYYNALLYDGQNVHTWKFPEIYLPIFFMIALQARR